MLQETDSDSAIRKGRPNLSHSQIYHLLKVSLMYDVYNGNINFDHKKIENYYEEYEKKIQIKNLLLW